MDVLTFSNSYLKALEEARPVVSWLRQQQRVNGGYISHQVTQLSLITTLV